MTTAIQKAIELLGGQAAMARSLSVHPALVSQWSTSRRPVAARHILAIEAATGVSRHELRPDVFGYPPEVEIAALANVRMSKRALRARLGLASDAHLAVVLQLPAEQVASWPEEGALPALPQIQKLLGHEPEAQGAAADQDPDEERIIPVEAA